MVFAYRRYLAVFFAILAGWRLNCSPRADDRRLARVLAAYSEGLSALIALDGR